MNFKSFQKIFSVTTAAVGVATFVGSVIYNYFFFLNLDIRFSQIPISFTDITQTFLYWLPYSLLNIAISFLLVWLLYPPAFMSREHAGSRGVMSAVNFLRQALPWIIIINFITYLLAGDISKEAEVNALTLFLILIALNISEKLPGYLVKQSIIQEGDVRKLGVIIFYPISFFIVIGIMGYNDSQKLHDINPPSSVITLNSKQIIKTNIIRALDKGVLVGTKNEPLDFISWPAIYDIKTVVNRIEFKGILCEWFNVVVFK